MPVQTDNIFSEHDIHCLFEDMDKTMSEHGKSDTAPAQAVMNGIRDIDSHAAESYSAPDFYYYKSDRSIQIKLIISAICLLISALGFNVMLTLSSLEKLYIESFVSQYSTVGKELQRKIGKALAFGKSIEKFVGMEGLLTETKENIGQIISDKQKVADDISVSVAVSDGQILYSTDETLRNTIQPRTKTSRATSHYIRYKNRYIIPLSVNSSLKNEQVATILISFDETPIRDMFRSVLIRNCKIITIIITVASLFLLFCFTKMLKNMDIRNFPKTRISIIMFLVIGISQIVFTGLNTNSFKDYYMQISGEKITLLGKLLKQNIEYLLNKGIRVDKLVKMDAMLGEVVAAAPELENIVITDYKGNRLYAASPKGVIDFQKASSGNIGIIGDLTPDTNYSISLEFRKTGDSPAEVEHYSGKIFANISEKVLTGRLKEIMLDSATVIAISIFFFVELLFLVFQYIEKPLAEIGQRPVVKYSAMRPVVFMFFIGIDICVSFLPLHMEKLYDPIIGLSKDMVMGLPISIQMFFTAISVLIAGVWCDRRGWHEPFLGGLFLSSMGFFYSWLAPNAIHFIFSLGLVGLGYGLSLMSCQGFVIAYTDHKERAHGLAQIYAGIYAGSVCGGAAGAMIADRIGYEKVFLIGAICLLIVIVYTIFSMYPAMHKPVRVIADTVEKSGSGIIQFFKFITNGKVISLILFSGFPAAVALVGFLNYFSPIYLKKIGTSQSDIGRVFMIYGVCYMYVSPILTKYISDSPHKKAYIAVSGILGGLAFISFYHIKAFSGMLAVAISILLLGLSACFAAMRNAYGLNFEISQDIGQGKAMGIFYSTARLGQVVAPILFAWMFLTAGIDQSVSILGASYLLISLLFLLWG